MPAGGDQRPPRRALLLYELDHRQPIGFLDRDGLPRDNQGKKVAVHDEGWFGDKRVEGWPMVLFAEVPCILHLSCGVSLAPMSRASAQTGPPRTS